MTPDQAYFIQPPRRHSAWRPNPGRESTYRRGESVQTTGASPVMIKDSCPFTWANLPSRSRARRGRASKADRQLSGAGA